MLSERRSRFAAGIVLVLMAGIGPVMAQAGPGSRYSDLKQCRPLARLDLPDRKLGAALGSPLRRCSGPQGFAAVVVDDGDRSWLVIEAGGRVDSLSRDMVETFSLGNFPSVSEPGQIEWRLDPAGAVKGLIVRIRYQRGDVSAQADSANASVLMAFRLKPGDAPALLGTATGNAEARALIDRAS